MDFLKQNILVLFILMIYTIPVNGLGVTHLRVNAVKNPIGVDGVPLFSWQIESEKRGCVQKQYHLIIRKDKEDGDLIFDSGDILSHQSISVNINNLTLEPSTRYYWTVSIKDNYGEEATSSEIVFFQTGLLDTGWSNAKWIMNTESSSVARFRKVFSVDKQIKKAVLHTSALGLYDILINDKRVGHILGCDTIYEELKPGWTDYRIRVNYSTYDVTPYLSDGKNVIGSTVTNGWWRGYVSRYIYGSRPLAFISKLVIEYTDGQREEIISDESWQTTICGPLTHGDIYDGESYDATQDASWMDNALWEACSISTDFAGEITSLVGADVYRDFSHVRRAEKITVYEGKVDTGTDYGTINILCQKQGILLPLSLKSGQTAIIDFGQNIVGWTPFTIKGGYGTQLRIRYSEMLNDDGSKDRGNDGPGGSLYLENLRDAKATLLYKFKGNDNGESYCPFSTYFGFRYCEITADADIEIIEISALPINSITEDSGSIETNNTSINKLFSNIQWSQRGNFVNIPTDCPQRDERLGWTGDAQVFSRTGMYNASSEAFYQKYLSDLRDSQSDEGTYPDMCPTITNWYGSAGWGDAGIIIPYNLYVMYKNKEMLKEHYSSMEKYMSWLSKQVEDGYHIGASVSYGDWLAYDKCDNSYVSAAYYAYNALLMTRMAYSLSDDEKDVYLQKGLYYDNLYKSLKKEFCERYWNPTPPENTQMTYILPLAFNLLDDEKKEYAKSMLIQGIHQNNGLLSTGFLGTSLFLTTLTENGLSDEAYNLLLQRENPSWLYSVDQGATTVWERWDSYTKDKGFGPASMNSFNHYAYGAVGEWMYRFMAGIEMEPDDNDSYHFLLHPDMDLRDKIPSGQGRVSEVSSSYLSKYGIIKSYWKVGKDDDIYYSCTIPANTTATLILPVLDEDYNIWEGASLEDDYKIVPYNNILNKKQISLELPSGEYNFHIHANTTAIKDIPDNKTMLEFVPKTRVINVKNKDINTVSIYDMEGKLIQSWKITNKQESNLVINSMIKGVHLVRVMASDKVYTYKVQL